MVALGLSGVLLGIVVSAPIGPVNIALIRKGLAAGFFPALMLGIGAAIADSFYVIVVFLGLAPFLQESAVFRLVLWGLGGGFLIYLGVTGIRSRDSLTVAAETSGKRVEVHPFWAGLGITLLNPMTLISWVAIGGAFFSTIALAESGSGGLLFIVGIFLGSSIWSGALALALHFARRFVNDRLLSAISVITSLVLIGFGLGFLIQAAQTFLG